MGRAIELYGGVRARVQLRRGPYSAGGVERNRAELRHWLERWGFSTEFAAHLLGLSRSGLSKKLHGHRPVRDRVMRTARDITLCLYSGTAPDGWPAGVPLPRPDQLPDPRPNGVLYEAEKDGIRSILLD